MAITVSATQVNTSANDPHQLTVVVLTGTSATPLGSILNNRTTGIGCAEGSVSGLTNGSWVMGQVCDDLLATAWAADAQTTTEDNYTTGGLRCISFRPAAATTGTPTTFGYTGSVAGDGCPKAFAEFLASGTIARDSASPAPVHLTTTATLTTASFTPASYPCLLVAMVGFGSSVGGSTPASVVSSAGTSGTWAKAAESAISGNGLASVWYLYQASAPPAAGGAVMPLRAAPGAAWLRQFRRKPIPPLATEAFAAPFTDAVTGAVTVAGSGGDSATLPGQAQSGPSWARRFRHRQQVLPQAESYGAPAADAGSGSAQVSGGGGDTPQMPAQAQPGPAWQRFFRHRQQPAQFASILTLPPGSITDAGTGTASAAGTRGASGSLADSGTAITSPSGSGSDTAVLPPASPGRAWLARFRHRQSVAPPPPAGAAFSGNLADAGTGTAAPQGQKASQGPLADSGTGVPAGAGAKAATGPGTAPGTGAASPAGGGGDSAVLPPAAPGAGWRRKFRHRQQPARFLAALGAPAADAAAGTAAASGTRSSSGSSADTGSGSQAASGTRSSAGTSLAPGTASASPSGSGGDSVVLPPAAAGRGWLRRFRHGQQPAQLVQALGASLADTGTGITGATGARTSQGAGTGTGAAIQAAAGNRASHGSLADSGTGAPVPSGSGSDTAQLPPAAPGPAWLRFFRRPDRSTAPSVLPPAPVRRIIFTSGQPQARWVTGQPGSRWATGPLAESRWNIGQPAARWETGAPQARWNIGRPAGGSVLTYLSQSTELVQVPVSAAGTGMPYDPTGDVVQFAFEPGAVAPGTWYAGSWSTPVANTFLAQCLIGPAGVVALTPGIYTIWMKITDSPEVPVRTPGMLQIQ